jgi:membrane fusion protein (multidrug efflux system)
MNTARFGNRLPLRRTSGNRSGRRIAAAVIAASLLAACEKPATPEPPLPVVSLLEVRNSAIPHTGILIGQLDSPQNVEVRARVEAFVEEIAFTEGGKVKQGDLLFKLDRRPFVEKLAVANASLAEAMVAQKKFEIDVSRLKPLAASGGVSQQDLDDAEASLEASKAMVESARSSVESAQLDLGYCEVKAPIDGLIGAKEVSVGDLVGKGEPTLLATMSSLDPMWFYCNISEADYIRTKTRAEELGKDLGTLPLTLILPGGKEHDKQGRIVFFDRAVNVKTGTMRVRVEFPNPTELLRPGMFARARIDGGSREGIKIPERALSELQGKSFVWVVDAEQKVSQRPVRTGDTVDSEVVVLEGLQPGERIVLEGVQKVHDGARVNVIAAEPAAVPAGSPLPQR